MAIDLSARGSRRQWLLFAVLLAVLAAIAFVQFRGSEPAGPASRTSNAQRPGAVPARAADPAEPLDVKLEVLSAARSSPEPVERNPFRFEARRPAAEVEEDEGEGPSGRSPSAPRESEGPVESPPPPPIPLKFIGIIESPQLGRLAALSDGRHVFHGRAGDIIEGRYRIVRIGVESIVLERVEGGAPQTIRLSGQ